MSTKRQSPRTEAAKAATAPPPAPTPVPTDPPVELEWLVLEDSAPIPHGGQMMTLAAGTRLSERRYGAGLIQRWGRVYGLKLKLITE